MVQGPLPIDLTDPKDIAAKMPLIRQLFSEKSGELEARKQELEALKVQVDLLARLVGPQRGSGVARVSGGGSFMVKGGRGGQSSPGQDRAIRALEKAGRPMGPTSLYRFMLAEGMDAPVNANALGANLWSAAKAGRVVKTPNGMYAPVGTATDRPPTDSDEAACKGFPTPPARPEPSQGKP